MLNATETRRLYAMEVCIEEVEPVIRNINSFMSFAKYVWRHEAPKNWPCPEIKLGQGTFYCGRYLSYCVGRSFIEIARPDAKISVLLHELTHALQNGSPSHGRKFCDRYFDLLVKYAHFDRFELETLADFYKVVYTSKT
jgi:hypothetical protein